MHLDNQSTVENSPEILFGHEKEQTPSTYSGPVLLDDSYEITQSGILTIHSPGVLANDDVTKGQTLTASLDTNVKNGALILKPDGGFTFIPDPKFYGKDSFKYVASDSCFFSKESQ